MNMTIQVAYAAILALVTFAVLVRAVYLAIETDDIPSTYKLFAARDALIRLVVEGKIDRNDPHFDAMYSNVTTILRSCRLLSGPRGWPLAHFSGVVFARNPAAGAKLVKMPSGSMPPVLCPIAEDITGALKHLADNHLGLVLQRDAARREVRKQQKERARQFLGDLAPHQRCA
jgi:hypothetical protein